MSVKTCEFFFIYTRLVTGTIDGVVTIIDILSGVVMYNDKLDGNDSRIISMEFTAMHYLTMGKY